MPKLFFSNFDFEDELAGRRTNPAALKSLHVSLSEMWSALSDLGDRLFDPYGEPLGEDVGTSRSSDDRERSVFRQLKSIDQRQLADCDQRLELVPWGWSPRCIELAQQLGVTANSPDLACVRTINDRSFGFNFEREASIGLDGATAVRSEVEFTASVNALVRDAVYSNGRDTAATEWIVKSQFSAAGRHCLRGQGPPTERQFAWIRKRTGEPRRGATSSEVLFVEPIVDRVREAGFQFWVDEHGARFDGCVEMVCDRNGQFRASIVTPLVASEWSQPLSHCTELAQQIHRMGYFGPLGIDAMLFRHSDGQLHPRAIQDVNGRFTMGRMALNLKQAVASDDEVAVWLHCDRNAADSLETVTHRLRTTFPMATKIVPTSTAKRSGKLPVLVACPSATDTAIVSAAIQTMFAR